MRGKHDLRVAQAVAFLISLAGVVFEISLTVFLRLYYSSTSFLCLFPHMIIGYVLIGFSSLLFWYTVFFCEVLRFRQSESVHCALEGSTVSCIGGTEDGGEE